MKKILFFIFISLSTLVKAVDKIPTFFSCTQPQRCIEHLFKDEKLWGNFHANYAMGVGLWKSGPSFKFSSISKQGEQRLEQQGQTLTPVIVLAPISDPYEMAITLNHELVHFVHLHNSLKLIGDHKKISNCITPYQLSLLKDESLAFKEEINFWMQSPKWFKEHFKGIFFESRLIEKKITYLEYYKILNEEMNRDKFFIERRYIELGEYPMCAKKLIGLSDR